MMKYKDYVATIEYDDDIEAFHGRIVNINSVITFEAKNVDDLKREMALSVDDYLDFCAENGEEPDKPYSGKLILRMNPELHQQVGKWAQVDGKSLNKWINEALETAVSQR